MNIPRRSIFLSLPLLLLAAATALHAQGQVMVTLVRPPDNQVRVADLWRVTLTNLTQQTYSVYLNGIVTETTDGEIVNAESKIFDLPPGTHVLDGNLLSPIKVNSSREPYKRIVIATGTVPSGEYEVCVYVKEAGTGLELGHDCYSTRVEQVTPSIPVSPGDGDRVEDLYPTFVWTPPVPVPPRLQPHYTIRIVEIIGRQTPYDAMLSNPAFFKQEDIPVSLFSYPSGARYFQPGKRYAWQISASAQGFPLGESEIWSFFYRPTEQEILMNEEEQQ